MPSSPTFAARFNSQPPEGGWYIFFWQCPFEILFQLTAARRRLVNMRNALLFRNWFQLTAARRRLEFC